MKTTLKTEDLASVLAHAYPHLEAGDPLKTFLIAECTGGPESETIGALNEMERLLDRVAQDVHRTQFSLEKYIQTVQLVAYVEFLIDKKMEHTTQRMRAFQLLHMPGLNDNLPSGIYDELVLDPKLVLAKLRAELSIKADLPEGASRDPLFESETNAKFQSQPTEDLRNGPCPADGQAVAVEGIPPGAPDSPADVQK